MASVQKKDCRGASHIMLTMLGNEFHIAEIKAVLLLSHIKISGACFTSKFLLFSLMAGWIEEMLLMLFFAV